MQVPKIINIVKNLGASKCDEKIEEVLVVWVATEPKGKGQVIVGWYEDANVYNNYQKLNEEELENRLKHDIKVYNISSKKAILLPMINEKK